MLPLQQLLLIPLQLLLSYYEYIQTHSTVCKVQCPGVKRLMMQS